MNFKKEQLFIHIISKGSKDNTYKFALSKFLLDFSNNNTKNKEYKITYDEVAEAFLKYYWFQECKYKIKQDFKTSSQPLVISIIQKYCGKEYIPYSYEKYFKKNPSIKLSLINEIKKDCLNDVIPRFQAKGSFEFYEHFHILSENKKRFKTSPKDKKYIILSKESHLYFSSNYNILSKLLILEWAKFLEKTNYTPKLISKIENLGNVNRSSLLKYKKILTQIDNICFYCENDLNGKKIHIDHFIPWSYIYEDAVWNLVLSCSSCNLKKSDYLANKTFLEKIKERNDINNFKNSNKDLSLLYENCHKSGFLVSFE